LHRAATASTIASGLSRRRLRFARAFSRRSISREAKPNPKEKARMSKENEKAKDQKGQTNRLNFLYFDFP
jgi:hypothetical protein